jgi:hypothetical protein
MSKLNCMRNGFNPIRRNRNIGTVRQGHGRNNRFTIPAICHSERTWWEQLGQYRTESRAVNSCELLFIIEQTRSEYIHPCSVEDICHILSLIPVEDWNGLQTFLLRQSTHKQRRVSPCWGRLAFAADIGQPGKSNIYSGPAIVFEAIDPTEKWTWGKSLTPGDAEELERLKADGHRVEDCGSHYLFMGNVESARATELYRTLMHEIGHWVDWQQRVEQPVGYDYEQLVNAYWARPVQEREAFAHRYADTMRSKLAQQGLIPFLKL